MALITCPECGKEVSDTAQSCPNCGYPIAQKEVVDKPVTDEDISNVSRKKSSKKIIITACLIIAVAVGVIFSLKGQNSIVGTWEDNSTFDGFVLIYEFSEDGSYSSFIRKGTITAPGGTGTYEIDGKTLNLNMSDGQSTSSEFSVKGDTMKWGIQTLTRQK